MNEKKKYFPKIILLKFFLSAFLIYGICISFTRYYYTQLDGDLPAIVVPVKNYMTVMKDPFGMNVLLHDSVYAATNRYFAHLSLMGYFKTAPLLLQKIFAPIDSIYISCALIKICIQFFLIFLIASYVTNKKNILDIDFLLACSLIYPFFQTFPNGYYREMAILDGSITYTFFYTLSITLVTLFFLPFFNALAGRKSFNFGWKGNALLILLTIIISFNGPLNVPVIILVCSSVILNHLVKNFKGVSSIQSSGSRIYLALKNIPSTLSVFFLFAILLCLYSFYLGTHNSENLWETVPLSTRYARLSGGFWHQYTDKWAQTILVFVTVVNSFIVSKLSPDIEAKKILKLFKWFGVLSLIYILMLPFGGYRAYRSDIVRWDTILPITIALLLFYSYFNLYILKKLRGRYYRICFIVSIVLISAHYIYAERGIVKANSCERSAMEKLAHSTERVVFIDNNCSLLNWGLELDTADSKDKTDLLLYWNVIRGQKLFYQK